MTKDDFIRKYGKPFNKELSYTQDNRPKEDFFYIDTIKTIRKLESKASVMDDYAVSRNRISKVKPNILNW